MSLRLYLKLAFLMLRNKKVPEAMIREDYDRLACDYDDSFARHVKHHSFDLIDRLNIPKGAKVLELACGTGVITGKILEKTVLPNTITAVDSSKGMIEKAKDKTGGRVNFIQSDMLATLRKLEEGQFDFAVCGWAIGYCSPKAILKGIHRVLKPGGTAAVIENSADTLKLVRDVSLEVMEKYPDEVEYVMDLPLRLPRSPDQLNGWCRRAGFRVKDSWQGETVFKFTSGAQVLAWVLKTGASAGFDRMMKPQAKAGCDRSFVEIMERCHKHNGSITVTHKFVASIVQKP